RLAVLREGAGERHSFQSTFQLKLVEGGAETAILLDTGRSHRAVNDKLGSNFGFHRRESRTRLGFGSTRIGSGGHSRSSACTSAIVGRRHLSEWFAHGFTFHKARTDSDASTTATPARFVANDLRRRARLSVSVNTLGTSAITGKFSARTTSSSRLKL